MLKIGCHLSSAGGFKAMALSAKEIGANTFQYFTRNPRGCVAKPIEKEDLNEFLKIYKEENFAPIVAHCPYTLNLCSAKENIRSFSKSVFKDDITRTDLIPGSFYNFHPGNHTGQGTETGIKQICDALNDIITKEQKTTILLETMAGKGSEIGGDFYELRKIIDNININEKIGVCLDTCHDFDGGYDIVSNLEGVIEEFDEIIGLERLHVIHLNDSKNTLGSKKDRHELIGKGNIGIKAIEKIINHSKLKNLVFILETPQETLGGYAKEIEMLKSLRK